MKIFELIPFKFSDALDLFLVSCFFYFVFLLFKGTRAVQMFFGFAFLVVVYFLAQWWQLNGVQWLFENLLTVGVVSIVILFQPELRGALTKIGQSASKTPWRKIVFNIPESQRLIEEIVKTCKDFSKKRRGAIMVFERRVGLRNVTDTGQYLDARLSQSLLRSIFYPNSPLHDGAVIVKNQRIWAAACTLPVSTFVSKKGLGMRHRAAIGIAQESDCYVVVVSEETGEISYVSRNKFRKGISIQILEELLQNHALEEKNG